MQRDFPPHPNKANSLLAATSKRYSNFVLQGKRRRGRQKTRWLDRVIKVTNMNLTQLWEALEDRRAWGVLVHGGVMKSRTRLNNNKHN